MRVKFFASLLFISCVVKAETYTIVQDRGVYEALGNSFIRGFSNNVEDTDIVRSIIVDFYDEPSNLRTINQIVADSVIKGKIVTLGTSITVQDNLTINELVVNIDKLILFFNQANFYPEKYYILSDETMFSRNLAGQIESQLKTKNQNVETVRVSTTQKLKPWIYDVGSVKGNIIINTAIHIQNSEDGSFLNKNGIEKFLSVWNRRALDVSLFSGKHLAIRYGISGYDAGKNAVCTFEQCKKIAPVQYLFVSPARFRELGYSKFYISSLHLIDGILHHE